ncbi:lipoate--protein ligase [Elizabethkingia sp. JS20170427COW]|uniref:lipoate--protein ligase n=1 Tax=Elizabethkingia sp. JS20170427COW TaxID=2583851 RepID=UPI001110645C|nr:lipoate--protein ligase [Elizabethkingia sp. JS20170427COW]QCX53613.1 lipoate--protein ligase [Elizabethkingia sp. JS20170427COW]
MIFIENEGNTDTHLNLALEEYIVRKFGKENNYLLFYINAPSIIIGRNQNTLEEINYEYITQQNIKVVRRVSGGGAVYHDLGNLNFSFITDHNLGDFSNFKSFTQPVIKVLKKLGIDAELKGRNDILIGEKKISGTAQFSTGKRMISHGTLLFDTDLDEVTKALQVKMSKIQSKGHKSVRSRVANISEFLKAPLTIEEFRKLLLEGLSEEDENFQHYHLTEEEWKGVYELKAQKYDTWDWNYGQSPKFNIQRVNKFTPGELDIRIFVEKGYVSEFKIYGDFFGFKPVSDLEELLLNTRYEKSDIVEKLKDIQISDYFGAITKNEFIDLVYGEDEE